MILEMRETRPLYYFFVTTITQFVLAVAVLLVISPLGLLGQLPWSMLGFLLLYNILISTMVAVILARNGSSDRDAVLRGGGLVLGHLVGLILGGFVGAHYGGPLWAIGAATVLYFVVGWMGARVSLWVGLELDHAISSAGEAPSQIQVRSTKANTTSLFITGAVIPLLFMAAAVFVKSSGLPVTQFPNVLPTARILLALLSIFSILIPWLRGAQWFRRAHMRVAGEPIVRFIGLSLCLAPAIFGFLLFLAFGMSITELSLFAVTASIAATTWGARRA